MRQILTVSINPVLRKKPESMAKKKHITKSEIINRALDKYLLRDEFYNLRKKLVL